MKEIERIIDPYIVGEEPLKTERRRILAKAIEQYLKKREDKLHKKILKLQMELCETRDYDRD